MMVISPSHEFDLVAVVEAFLASSDRVWHVDRHVLPLIEVPSSNELEMACKTAIELATQWTRARGGLRNDVLTSLPYAIVDDDWLVGAPNATPPHVYICIARDAAAFDPVRHEGVCSDRSGINVVDRWLTANTCVFRVEGAYPGEPGAWIVRTKDVAVTGGDAH